LAEVTAATGQYTNKSRKCKRARLDQFSDVFDPMDDMGKHALRIEYSRIDWTPIPLFKPAFSEVTSGDVVWLHTRCVADTVRKYPFQ
jgi:hypothetical protein